MIKDNKGPIMGLLFLVRILYDLNCPWYWDQNATTDIEKYPWKTLSLRAFTTVAGGNDNNTPEALWAARLKITDDDTIIIHMYIVYIEQE